MVSYQSQNWTIYVLNVFTDCSVLGSFLRKVCKRCFSCCHSNLTNVALFVVQHTFFNCDVYFSNQKKIWYPRVAVTFWKLVVKYVCLLSPPPLLEMYYINSCLWQLHGGYRMQQTLVGCKFQEKVDDTWQVVFLFKWPPAVPCTRHPEGIRSWKVDENAREFVAVEAR